MTDTLTAPATQWRTNSALWYGLVLIVLGIATEFLYFLQPPEPIPHVLPWINLSVPVTGSILLLFGLLRAFRQPALFRGKIWGSVVTVIALVLVAGNIFVFRQTRDVPPSAGAPRVGQHLSDFTLPDSNGQPTSLSQLFAASADGSQPKAVLLVFYRGYW